MNHSAVCQAAPSQKNCQLRDSHRRFLCLCENLSAGPLNINPSNRGYGLQREAQRIRQHLLASLPDVSTTITILGLCFLAVTAANVGAKITDTAGMGGVLYDHHMFDNLLQSFQAATYYDIDFDCRQLSSSNESFGLGRQKSHDAAPGSQSSIPEFGNDNFSIGNWEQKKGISRDGHMKLSTPINFAGQRNYTLPLMPQVSSVCVPAPSEHGFAGFAIDFMMGGVFAVLIQTQDEMIKTGRLPEPYKGIGECFSLTSEDERFTSLWRGNTANGIYDFPTQALNLVFKDYFKRMFNFKNDIDGYWKWFAACTVLAVVVADWFQTNKDKLPIKSQLDSLINLGNELTDASRVDDAIHCYRSCLALQLNHPQALTNRGNPYMEWNMISAAATFYKATMAVTTGLFIPLCNLAFISTHQGYYADTISSCNEVLRIDPMEADGLVNWGNPFKEIGRVRDAIQDYLRAVALRPTMIEGYSNLASANRDSGRVGAAMKSSTQALLL